MKTFEFWFNFLYILFPSVKFSIGSDNGLALNTWQATTWTNNYKVLWYHVASLDHNELKSVVAKIY